MPDFPEQELTLLIQHGRDREATELALQGLNPLPEGDPMDPRSQLRQILPLVSRLVDGLDEQQLAMPTPCDDFAVRDVLAHMVGGARQFAAAFRGDDGSPAGELPDDVVAVFPAAMDELEAAIASPGALERTIAAPFGEVSGETFARFVAMDGLVHGWDIASATGQRYEPSADVVAAVDGFTRQALTDELRDGTTFAAATEAPAGSSHLVRLVAFTGRRV